MDIKFVQVAFDTGPYGAKNMAEPTMIAIAPAIANRFISGDPAASQCHSPQPWNVWRLVLNRKEKQVHPEYEKGWV